MSDGLNERDLSAGEAGHGDEAHDASMTPAPQVHQSAADAAGPDDQAVDKSGDIASDATTLPTGQFPSVDDGVDQVGELAPEDPDEWMSIGLMTVERAEGALVFETLRRPVVSLGSFFASRIVRLPVPEDILGLDDSELTEIVVPFVSTQLRGEPLPSRWTEIFPAWKAGVKAKGEGRMLIVPAWDLREEDRAYIGRASESALMVAGQVGLGSHFNIDRREFACGMEAASSDLIVGVNQTSAARGRIVEVDIASISSLAENADFIMDEPEKGPRWGAGAVAIAHEWRGLLPESVEPAAATVFAWSEGEDEVDEIALEKDTDALELALKSGLEEIEDPFVFESRDAVWSRGATAPLTLTRGHMDDLLGGMRAILCLEAAEFGQPDPEITCSPAMVPYMHYAFGIPIDGVLVVQGGYRGEGVDETPDGGETEDPDGLISIRDALGIELGRGGKAGWNEPNCLGVEYLKGKYRVEAAQDIVRWFWPKGSAIRIYKGNRASSAETGPAYRSVETPSDISGHDILEAGETLSRIMAEIGWRQAEIDELLGL